MTPEKGLNSKGGDKFRWLTVYELSALCNKAEIYVGSNVLIDLKPLELSLREQRLCYLETMMVFQIATMGAYSNRSDTSRFFVFPPSLIR